MENDLFEEGKTDLFIPHDGVEFIHNILFYLGYQHDQLASKEARAKGLDTIWQLLQLDLIEIFRIGPTGSKEKDRALSNEEVFKYVQGIWNEGADYPDFYGMIQFKHKDWYVQKLGDLGLTSTTDWRDFVKENIGNLKEWIYKNRP